MLAIKMFHGTTEEAAKQILKSGFLTNTYFAYHLEETIMMGGEWVFEVLFDEKPTEYWEYISREPIGLERIVSLVHYDPVIAFENKDAQMEYRKKTLKQNWDDGVKLCEHCRGKGEMEDHPMYTRWRDNKKITVCPKCAGHGVVVVSGDSDIYAHQVYEGEGK
jgi:hypothetical protein